MTIRISPVAARWTAVAVTALVTTLSHLPASAQSCSPIRLPGQGVVETQLQIDLIGVRDRCAPAGLTFPNTAPTCSGPTRLLIAPGRDRCINPIDTIRPPDLRPAPQPVPVVGPWPGPQPGPQPGPWPGPRPGPDPAPWRR